MTKPITAAAAMILVEECKLRLDEPVDRLLPELADRRVLKRLDGPLDDTVPASRPITVRDLLTFRMGFGIVMAPPGTVSDPDARSTSLGSARGPNPSRPPRPDEWMRRLGSAAADAPARREVDVPHRLRRAGRADRARRGPAAGDFPARAHLRAARHEGHRASACPPRSSTASRPSYMQPIPDTGALAALRRPREAATGAAPPAFPSGGGGLVSTVDDYLAFGDDDARTRAATVAERILSRPSVEAMTTDHLTAAQESRVGLVPRRFRQCRLGVRHGGRHSAPRHGVHPLAASAGTVAWARSWRSDPSEDMVAILLTQASWTSPAPPRVTPRLLDLGLPGDRRLNISVVGAWPAGRE